MEDKKKNWFMRHKIISVLLILVVLGIFGSASGGSKTSNAPSGSQTTSNKQEETKVGLNEAVQDGDLSFTVTDVKQQKTVGNSYTQKTAQGMYYIVSLKIENKAKKTVTFDSSMAKVMDSEDREFTYSIDGQTAKGMAEGKVDLFLQQIQPSLSYSGDMVFDLPENASNPVLVVKGSLFSKGTRIQLQ